jgi:HPt (histidine-containing phosphotransfer) domain-containing protein
VIGRPSDDAVDGQVLDELRQFLGGDDPTVLSELINLFFQESRSHLNEMAAAVRQCNAERVAQAAHRLHGSAGYVGARGIMVLSADVERRAESGSLDGVASMVGRLQTVLDALRPRLLA